MDFQGHIITDAATLHQVLATAPEIVACDTETYKTRPTQKDARLLGLSLSWVGAQGPVAVYIPKFVYSHKSRMWCLASELFEFELPGLLRRHKFVGWNASYDRTWLDYEFEDFRYKTQWAADGRILWHLSNQDESIRGFGLKLAQTKLLGWPSTNEEALERNVRAKGGSLANGDHYLADLPVLAHYATLDTVSTMQAYLHLKPFFDKHNYWDFANKLMQYSFLLKEASDLGVKCDLDKLKEARDYFASAREQSGVSLRAECVEELALIENGWRTEKVESLKTANGRANFLSSPARWSRFNPGSSQQRAHLLHTVLKFPVLERTPTGQPKTSRDLIENINHPAAKHLASYSENKKNNETCETYIGAWSEGRLHPGYDICATVSGRLGGFVPYLLNAPFSEPRIMGAFSVDPGYVGVHADLTAVEPCITGAYSEDENLLKVYRDGKGDIYLDLALELFPDREDLRADYDPNGPAPTAAIKEKYKVIRAICKIIHLAVGYTGSYITICKNLNKAGFPTTPSEARVLVARYWQKFAEVKEFTKKLKAVYLQQGHIRNLMGRIIHVDPRFIKDLLNRLVQSSGHDILVEWVMRIHQELNAAELDWKPMLIDIHDATGVMVKEGQQEAVKSIFLSTLEGLNNELNLGVRIRAEAKFFHSLAGLKGDE